MSFEEWYKGVSQSLGIHRDPKHPMHFYDYEAAYEAGEPIPKKGEHMDSRYKSPLHPSRFLKGVEIGRPDIPYWDTLNEKEAAMQDIVKSNYERQELLNRYGF